MAEAPPPPPDSLPPKKLRTKVRKAHPDMGRNELSEETEVLTNGPKLTRRFLDHIVRPGHEALKGTVRDCNMWCTKGFKVTLENSLDFEKAYSWVDERLKGVGNLHIMLVVYGLSETRRRTALGKGVTTVLSWIKTAEYGPYPMALVIEDMVLEWGPSSLVVPRKFLAQQEGLFAAQIHQFGTFRDEAAQTEEELRGVAGRSMDYFKQLELFGKLAVCREELIIRLVEVITSYNKRYYYNSRTRNSKHFLCDALKALEICNPKELEFEDQLGEEFQRLKRGKRVRGHEYRSHEEVDQYVATHLEELTKHSLEYLNHVYTQFHRNSKKKARNPREWECLELHCKIVQDKLREHCIHMPELQ